MDSNGTFAIGTLYRANMSAMVVKSGNGVVTLPLAQVFFDKRVGIADWKLDLTDSAQRTVVASGNTLSDYTLNWRDVTRDYTNFTPYVVSDMLAAISCQVPGVVAANVASLPTVEGLVEQFQVRGSRLGSEAHIMVDSGWIRELVFLCGCPSADAPVGVVVLKNDGRVGLGSTHRNVDSLSASVVLGVNGVTLIADGDGRVDLNEDLIINNVGHILKGPNFGSSNRLQFYSDCERSLTVKKDGVLDLSSFTASDHFVEFAGNVKLLLEPGATILMGGGVLRAADHARIESVPVSDLTQFSFGTTPTSIDPLRVRFIGTGTVQLDEDSVFMVGDDSYVGVETFGPGECTSFSSTTSLLFDIRGRAKMSIGSGSGVNNSVFQVGNTSDHVDSSITFSLELNGVDSEFCITSRGFFGLGVGMVDNFFLSPSDWRVDALWNIETISIKVPEGTFRHDRIFNSDDPYASLLAIGNRNTGSIFTFDYDSPAPVSGTTQATILGGGNMALIGPDGGGGPVYLEPTVQTTDGLLSSRLTVGLFSSKHVLEDPNHVVQPANPTTATGLFTFWKSHDGFDVGTPVNSIATLFINASRDEHNLISVGYADGVTIVRGLLTEITGRYGIPVKKSDFNHTFEIGSVFGDLGSPLEPGVPPRSVQEAFEIP